VDDYGVDLGEIARVIERAEVLVVRLQVVHRRILVDFRTSDSDGPFVQAVAPATSVEERFRSLKSLRPNFALPDRIMSFAWPRGVTALAEAGIADLIRDRLAGHDDALTQLDEALTVLTAEEQSTMIAAIRGGEGFQTIWEREPS
jgi:hypothetical protein